ncbi:MAG TPA: hypothetical protein VNN79_25575, partial [Actinomycetota bacterium]|nr:hypothetical protein [Actinomycetota bacterium]
LLGVRGLSPVEGTAFSRRAVVANTIAYRRRKGTASMLEQLARDVTGWPARAVEFFQLLEWTQYVNHVRPASLRTPDLRDAERLELVGGPFDETARTVDVRHIDTGRGRYNIPNVGLFLWRLQAYAVQDADAGPAGGPSGARFTFDPLLRDLPLFNRPQTEREITHLAREENVPAVLRRRVLARELEERRQALVDGRTPRALYFGPEPVLAVRVDGAAHPLPPDRVLVCDLEAWRRPRRSKAYVRASDGATVRRRIDVAVDPVLGRLTFPRGVHHSRVQVSFLYGCSGDIGGGPYDRRSSLMTAPGPDDTTWQIGVSTAIPPVPGEIVSTLGEAVQAWNAQPPGTVGVIAVMDSATYEEDLTGAGGRIVVPATSRLLLVAADWPQSDPTAPAGEDREPGHYVPDGLRPHLQGNVAVRGIPGAEGQRLGELIVDGLLVEGRLTVSPGRLGSLTVSNCTLDPSQGGIVGQPSADPQRTNDELSVQLARSVVGRIRLPETFPRLSVADGIVDGSGAPGGAAIAASGTEVDVQTSTVLGTTAAGSLEAGNSVFAGVVTVEHRQTGCVRFSYVPPGSRTARRYRCRPADDDEAGRVVPQFTSVRFGDPAYCQLATGGPPEIARGADDEGEMGAFHALQQPQRLANLEANLGQYLRFGLEAGIFRVT